MNRIYSPLLLPGDKIAIDKDDHIKKIPCDLIIIQGSCTVDESSISGETKDKYKKPIEQKPNQFIDDPINLKECTNNILYAGSTLRSITEPMICRVWKTGVDTEMGKLFKDKLTVKTTNFKIQELKFIFIQTFIILIACSSILFLETGTKFFLFAELLLLFSRCSSNFLMPSLGIPEFIMSLIFDSEGIYTQNPNHIPKAANVDVCCFDKTGTLVESQVEISSIESPIGNSRTIQIINCCQESLQGDDKNKKRDPLDEAIFGIINPDVAEAVYTSSSPAKNSKVQIPKIEFTLLQEFPFKSELKRSGVIAKFGNEKVYCVKGAPETIEKFLKPGDKDSDAFKKYRKYTADGFRVIALASKPITSVNNEEQKDLEKDLDFSGFILLKSSLQAKAKETCENLLDSGIKVVMITGDNHLTASNVAKEVGIVGEIVYGQEIDDALANDEFFKKISVFARADPHQKQRIIEKYNSLKLNTMMVGDGMNDMGALNKASVGVSLVNKEGCASTDGSFGLLQQKLDSIIKIIQYSRSSVASRIQQYKTLVLLSFLQVLFNISIRGNDSTWRSWFLVFYIYSIIFIAFGLFSFPSSCFSGLYAKLKNWIFDSSEYVELLEIHQKLTKKRPVGSIFSLYGITSIFFQVIIYGCGYFFLYRKFLLNPVASEGVGSMPYYTAFVALYVFVLTTVFLVNYIGLPFKESFWNTVIEKIMVLGAYLTFLNLLFDFIPFTNRIFGLVSLKNYRNDILVPCLAVLAASLLVEKILFKLFSQETPKTLD